MDHWTRIWKESYEKNNGRKPAYDLWLDRYAAVLEISRDTPVIDLGCGMGNDSLYLAERGFSIVACDMSEFAVRCVKEAVPDAETKVFDMLGGLPFEDGAAKIIIADLSLHYFSWKDTLFIAGEIRRVLSGGGYLLCRLNSTKDTAHGAGRGDRIEDNYYAIDGNNKRFFDKAQIESLFTGWAVEVCTEYRMDRYRDPKILWEVSVRKVGD